MVKIVSIFVIGLLSSFCLFAQEAGPFISASAGQLRTSTTIPAGFTADNKSNVWAIGGGYRVNQHFGVEASYRDFGTLSIRGETTTDRNGTSWTYGGFLAYPFTEKIEGTLRAGWIDWKVESVNAARNEQSKATGTNSYYGAGVSWLLNQKTSVGMNWMRYESPASNIQSNPIILEIATQYRF